MNAHGKKTRSKADSGKKKREKTINKRSESKKKARNKTSKAAGSYRRMPLLIEIDGVGMFQITVSPERKNEVLPSFIDIDCGDDFDFKTTEDGGRYAFRPFNDRK